MATTAQATAAKYSVEKHYTDGTKETLDFIFIRCTDKNGNYCEWKDEVSAPDATDATILTNAKAYFKDNCTEKAAKAENHDEAKALN